MRFLPLVLTLLLGAGCVGTLTPVDDDDGSGGGGDDDGGGGGGSLAKSMFDTDVAPMLQTTCASCHAGTGGVVAPKFLGVNGITGYYASLIGQTALVGNWNPAAASLLTKGAHSTARAWTTAEADLIEAWLLAEAEERL